VEHWSRRRQTKRCEKVETEREERGELFTIIGSATHDFSGIGPEVEAVALK
jgi:hypothetical protein